MKKKNELLPSQQLEGRYVHKTHLQEVTFQTCSAGYWINHDADSAPKGCL